MNNSLNTLIASVMLATATQALAASSVDLSVRGLITPSACEVSVSNGGQFDLGKLAVKDLSPTDVTYLPEMDAQVTTTCEGPTLLALEPKDNRAGSSYINDDYSFGMGLINGTEKVGSLQARLRSHMADGEQVYSINSSDGGLTWINGGSFQTTGNLVSVYRAGADGTPSPVQLLVSNLRVEPMIAPTNSLTLTNEVPIDGSITLTVRYL